MGGGGREEEIEKARERKKNRKTQREKGEGRKEREEMRERGGEKKDRKTQKEEGERKRRGELREPTFPQAMSECLSQKTQVLIQRGEKRGHTRLLGINKEKKRTKRTK